MRLSGVAHCRHVLLAALLVLSTHPGFANEPSWGAFIGARSAEKPEWFKESFLEFEEDVLEAAAAGRRVMLYFHQDGCPYCARLVEENFANPEIRDYIVQNFDGISLNLWGDREVVSVSGRKFTEKTFAAALKVQFTPTLIFLDERGQVALRLNGYYPPEDFRAALRFVAQKLEAQTSFAEYRLQNRKPAAGKLIEEDFYLAEDDLGRLLQTKNRPLVVYFEAANCADCEIMHQRILHDPATRKLVRQASNVQFDISSQQPLTTPDGRQTTALQWAAELGIAYTPSLVFFDTSGQQVMRIDAFLKTFHFQSVYAYVLEQAYLETPQFQRYISARADRIRESGHDTDIWGYHSFHD